MAILTNIADYIEKLSIESWICIIVFESIALYALILGIVWGFVVFTVITILLILLMQWLHY